MYLIISPKRSLEVSLFFAEINLSYFEESQISVLIWFTKGILLTCWPISESKSLLCLKSKSPEQRCRPLFVWSNFEGCLVLFAPAFADQAHLSHCIVNLVGINGNNRPFAIWFNLKRRKETCGHLLWYFLANLTVVLRKRFTDCWVSKLEFTNSMPNKVLIAGTKIGTEQLSRQRGCQPDGGGQLRPCAFRFRRPWHSCYPCCPCCPCCRQEHQSS